MDVPGVRQTTNLKRCVLGYLFTLPEFRERVTNTLAKLCPLRLGAILLLSTLGFLPGHPLAAQRHKPPSSQAPGGIAEIAASGPQRRQGELYIADKEVNVVYLDMRLLADYVEYNNNT